LTCTSADHDQWRRLASGPGDTRQDAPSATVDLDVNVSAIDAATAQASVICLRDFGRVLAAI
jgi:hypothetical protein